MPALRRLTFVAPALFLGFFFLYPLVNVLQYGLDWQAWQWLGGRYVRLNLAVALLQAVLSVVATFVLAVPLAWLYHRFRIPGARWHLAIHAAPFVLPVFVIVGAVRGMFGPFGWVTGATGFDLLASWGPLGAIVLAHAYYNYGFAARLLHQALEHRPRRLEEAAQALGAPGRSAWWRVTAPLMAPAIFSIVLLVFLFSFTSFGVVLLLGDGTINTLETLLYRNTLGIRQRLDRAAALGLLQLIINVGLIAAYMALRRRQTPHEPAPRRASKAATITALGALGAGVLPAATVLAGGFRYQGAWSWEPWRSLLDPAHPAHVVGFDLLHAVDRSLFYAFWSALLSVVLVALLAYTRGRGRKWLEAIAALPLGTSTVLVGFGLMITFGSGAAWDLRGSLLQIIIAHALVAFPFVARTMLPAVDAHDRRLDDAATALGASPWQVLWRIHWPLLRRPFAVALGFAIAISLGDFGASLILMRPDNMSLAVWIGRHDRPFQEIAHAQMLALSGALMLLAVVALVMIEVLAGRKHAVHR